MSDTNQKAVPDYIKEAAIKKYPETFESRGVDLDDLYCKVKREAFISGATSPASARYHQSDFQIAWELSKSRDKPFFIDTFRTLLNQFDREEISISKMVEELNVVAYKWRAESSKTKE